MMRAYQDISSQFSTVLQGSSRTYVMTCYHEISIFASLFHKRRRKLNNSLIICYPFIGFRNTGRQADTMNQSIPGKKYSPVIS